MYRLAAGADLLFQNLPYPERVRAIHQAGFDVETWNPWRQDVEGLVRLGIPIASMQGYLRGGLATAQEAGQLLATARDLVPLAHRLGCSTLVVHGGELEDGAVVAPRDRITGAMRRCAVETLGRLAQLGEEEGVVYCLENLGRRVDHPGAPFASTEETRSLVAAVDSPALRMMLDLYHAQEDEGHLLETLRAAGPLIGAIHVADVPGRREPGTGEVRWEAVACELRAMRYTGRVGLEAKASGPDQLALARFRAAFAADEPKSKDTCTINQLEQGSQS